MGRLRIKTSKRQVYGRWHGGPNYAFGDHTRVEIFNSLTEAENALYVRQHCGDRWRNLFRYVHFGDERVLTPVVDESSYIEVWFDLSEESLEGLEDLPEPDRYVFFGPRGGVRSEVSLP